LGISTRQCDLKNNTRNHIHIQAATLIGRRGGREKKKKEGGREEKGRRGASKKPP
jgi:hypothetical protein